MKKGFTLIELLAVMAVLAILALVSIPAVTGIIEKSRMGTFRDGALGILDSAKQAYVSRAGTEMVIQMPNNTIVVDGEKTNDTISYKGTKPEGGYVKVTADGKASMAIYSKKYCAYKRETEDDVSVKKYNDPSECTVD